ncbi:hypothetical protein [Marinobacter sp.]|jgi:hypothetical protein|uniref:hypothetical protein n=1 Tax=Marinobacter sp. TaxID=50741 RepID=UPI000C9030A3|nr:hypothetical protein [Marinobacter sp.]MAK50990.1 hypothetical protein [Marinobacter sp.]|tara:strand:- start:170 stop:571 length:402 start_codon:yes stop_codon:yes gene_type:complete
MKKFERKKQERGTMFTLDYSRSTRAYKNGTVNMKTVYLNDVTEGRSGKKFTSTIQMLVPVEPMECSKRIKEHMARHPNDVQQKRDEMHIPGNVRQAKTGKRDKKLAEFYKTHVYAYVSEGKRRWIKIPEGDEQ